MMELSSQCNKDLPSATESVTSVLPEDISLSSTNHGDVDNNDVEDGNHLFYDSVTTPTGNTSKTLTPLTPQNDGACTIPYRPISWSPDSLADSITSAQYDDRRWSQGTHRTDTSSKEGSRVLSQDTEQTEVDSHISAEDVSDPVFSELESKLDNQLQEVTKSIQESFQMSSPTKHSPHSPERAFVTSNESENIIQLTSPQYTDDDLSYLLQYIKSSNTDSTSSSITDQHQQIPYSTSKDLACIHDWDFDWDKDIVKSHSGSSVSTKQSTDKKDGSVSGGSICGGCGAKSTEFSTDLSRTSSVNDYEPFATKVITTNKYEHVFITHKSPSITCDVIEKDTEHQTQDHHDHSYINKHDYDSTVLLEKRKLKDNRVSSLPNVRTEFDDKLDHLLQRMDVAFQNLVTTVPKSGDGRGDVTEEEETRPVIPAMRAPADVAEDNMDNEHTLKSSPDLIIEAQDIGDDKITQENQLPSDGNVVNLNSTRVHSPQYNRGSSCEIQSDRRSNIPIHNGHLCPTVPLASMDDFSDAATASVGQGSASSSVHDDDDDGDVDERISHHSESDEETETGESYSLLRSSNLDSQCDIDSLGIPNKRGNNIQNGPTSNIYGNNNTKFNHQHHHIVDMNHRNSPFHPPHSHHQRHHAWIEQVIQSTEDLERIFVQNGMDHNTTEGGGVDHLAATTTTTLIYDDPVLAHSAEADICSSIEKYHWDFLEFAEKYFNIHTVSSSGPSGALSKTVNFVKRRPNQEVFPVEDLVRYTRNVVLNTSLVRLLNPAKVVLAQSMFKDICKYIRGDLKAELAYMTLRDIVATGIEHIELRDEIYSQILRQSRGNPTEESLYRVWHIMSLCAVSFNPSKTLLKYIVSHLRNETENNDDNIVSYAEYCLQRMTTPRRKARTMPPAFPEIEAVVCLQAMVHPIHFLNGRCELLEVSPDCLARDAVKVIAEKIGLQDSQGWAFYESTPDYDRHIHEDEYLADIISKWEQRRVNQIKGKKRLSRKQRKLLAEMKLSSPKKGSPKKAGSPKKSSPRKGSPKLLPVTIPPLKDFGKLVFCKRMFQPLADMNNEDEVELQLLYSQAAHYAVQLDEFNLSTPIALHLSGLQAQIEFGDYDPNKPHRYQHTSDFICERLLEHSSHNWSEELASAHNKYGANKTQPECMKRYLTIVSQFPLYGCTKIFAHYRGIWPYGAETVLAVDYEGIKFISIQEKTIAFTFYYSEIEDIILEEKRGEFYIVIQLCNYISPSQQKCFLFECLDLEDFGKCIEYHSPRHAVWLHTSRSWRHRQYQPPDDWLKLSDQIISCRRLLIQKSIISTSSQEESGMLRTALNRLGRSKGKGSNPGEYVEDEELFEYMDLHHPFWSFTKLPFKTSLLLFQNHEMEDVAARMFNSTLVYTGLESAAILEDMDLVVVVQTLIIKCMEKDDLCNELYLQLIKETTNTHAESNQKAITRYWHLMTMATCVMFPPNPVIFNYLTLHLKRYAMQGSQTEEGQYALFCIKCVYRTLEGGGRKWPPSFKEIDFVTNRQAIEARVSLPDGHQMLVEFDSASTCGEVMQLIKAKAGTRLDADGYGMYLVLGDAENYIESEEKLADSLHQWEKWAKTTGCRDLKFLFRKRLFVEPFMNLHDPVEVDMLYHQSVTDLFDQKIPLTKKDAVDLCALRAQAEFGDFGYANNFDYTSVMRILPRHLRELIDLSDISITHKKLIGLSPMSANIAFMDVLRHWPLFGATIFEVSNNSIDSLPKTLWLAVTQLGVHLMEKKGQTIYFTYTFQEICEVSPDQKNLTLVVGNNHDSPSLIFVTNQAREIVQLISDYKENTSSNNESRRERSRYKSKSPKTSAKSASGKGKQSRKRKESHDNNGDNDGNVSVDRGKKSSGALNKMHGLLIGKHEKGLLDSGSIGGFDSVKSSPEGSLLLAGTDSMLPLLSKESLAMKESTSSHCSHSSSSSKQLPMCTEL